jgi:hypothetical protein
MYQEARWTRTDFRALFWKRLQSPPHNHPRPPILNQNATKCQPNDMVYRSLHFLDAPNVVGADDQGNVDKLPARELAAVGANKAERSRRLPNKEFIPLKKISQRNKFRSTGSHAIF